MATFDRNSPASALIKSRYPLTQNRSTKETWHVTLDLQNIELDYHPGDSVGIYPQNDPTIVQTFIEAIGTSPKQPILHNRSGETISLLDFLTHRANLGRIPTSVLKCIQKHHPQKELEELLNGDALKETLSNTDPVHLFVRFAKSPLPPEEICNFLPPMLPRFYSVASSKLHNPNELDLTIALFHWSVGEETRYGVASHFLCHLAEMGKTPIPLFVQRAKHFRLPEDHSKDIIMIGPGTGIAPFRAFMQERAYFGANGKHWLFFGERNEKSDFFYKTEWEKHKTLRLDTAFSRDQEEKVYVHHKIEENGEELLSWLEGGAHLYVCGDAKAMAKDVDRTLRAIIAREKNCTENEAKSYLKALKQKGQYLLDVY